MLLLVCSRSFFKKSHAGDENDMSIVNEYFIKLYWNLVVEEYKSDD